MINSANATLTGREDDSLFQKSGLDNGIRIVSEHIPTVRSVSVGLWVDVGSGSEASDRAGITHFLEHMVFKGTRRRNMTQIARSIESIGGYLNAFTTKEHTCYYARVLDDHLEKAVDVLSDLVTEPIFKSSEIIKEKQVVLEELKQSEDEPDDLIHDYLEKVLYHPHPLGEPVIGKTESIMGFDRNLLFDHLEKNYTPDKIIVAAAGNVDHGKLAILCEKYLGGLKRSACKNGKTRLPKRRNEFVEYRKPIQQAYLCLGTKTFGIHSKDRFPLIVMNALLGEGMSSRLNQTIREKKGLAYTTYSFVTFLRETGLFGVYVGTDGGNVDKSLKLIMREFEKLNEKPVSRAELKRTVSQIKGNMMLGLENMSSRMMRIGAGELYFRKYSSLDSILKKLNAVTVEDVQRVSRSILNAENFSTVVFKPSVKN